MKKRLLIGAMLLASVFVFAACNNDDNDGYNQGDLIDFEVPSIELEDFDVPPRNPLAR